MSTKAAPTMIAEKHLDHIYAKLGVGTRTEAVVTAMGIPPFLGARR